MLSAWTLGGHLLLRRVDDSSGAPAASRIPRRNLTAGRGVSLTADTRFLCGTSLENVLKNNVLHFFINVMVQCDVLGLGSPTRGAERCTTTAQIDNTGSASRHLRPQAGLHGFLLRETVFRKADG